MLGKCIKNEFVNRWKQVASLLGGVFTFSLVVLIMDQLDKNVINNSYYSAIVNITEVVYVLALFGAIIGMMFMPFMDFSKRFFKDQGYLTHTLPVKTSTLIVGRMVCDVCMVVLAALVYPLAACIASGNFNFFGELLDDITDLLHMVGSTADAALVLAVMVAGFIAIFMSILFSLWQLNTAYAFGHMFNKGKRILSVVGYIALWVIFEMVMVLLNKILEIPGIHNWISGVIDNIESSAGSMLLVLSMIDIGMLLGVAVLAVATSFILKNHLNLE